ncbi:MSHA biogenesis protein MshP [Pseudoduganella sp. HUAS MS19]
MKNRNQRGFGYIAAIVVVVVLAMLGVASVRLTTTQQTGIAQDILSARAWQAARAGSEWGLYNALRLNKCSQVPTTLDLRGDTGFAVSVTCNAFVFSEGEVPGSPGTPQAKTVFTIDAIACNASACPDNAKSATLEYTERRRVVTACGLQNGPPPLEPC